MNKGVLYALLSYVLWGFLPIYLKALALAGPQEILAHRIIWSFVLLAGLLLIRNHWRWLLNAIRDWRILLTFTLTSLLLSINWLTYIWAVQHDHIIDSSLGYFMTPLVNVLLGILILGERLRQWQLISIGIAISGVLYLTFNAGALPWVSLTLAFSFGSYALIRKVAKLDALEGLFLETLVLSVPALIYLTQLESAGSSTFGHVSSSFNLLFIFTGVMTAVPLLLFGAGARLMSLSTMGILQYITPSMQFVIGVVIYHEAFTTTRMIGFSMIWLALFVYSVEGLLARQRKNTFQYAH